MKDPRINLQGIEMALVNMHMFAYVWKSNSHHNTMVEQLEQIIGNGLQKPIDAGIFFRIPVGWQEAKDQPRSIGVPDKCTRAHVEKQTDINGTPQPV